MNSSGTSVDLPLITEKLRDSWTSGRSREAIIQEMRMAGLNQIACIKLLRDISGIALSDAKEAVHFSAAWADRRESNEVLHEAAFEAANQLGFREVPS